MHFSLRDVCQFAAELERSFQQYYHVSMTEVDQRDEVLLLEHLASAADTRFDVYVFDFGDTTGAPSAFAAQKPEAISTQSLLFNHENGSDHADIFINAAAVNLCWTRFCMVKEASHVALRRNMNALAGERYPDNATIRSIIELLQDIVRFKYSLNDIGKAEYPVAIHAENAAELIAILLLYPPRKMIGDRDGIMTREGIGHQNRSALGAVDFFPTADRHKVPQRYVELMLGWDQLDFFAPLFDQIVAAS